jgi:hypothetical protein
MSVGRTTDAGEEQLFFALNDPYRRLGRGAAKLRLSVRHLAFAKQQWNSARRLGKLQEGNPFADVKFPPMWLVAEKASSGYISGHPEDIPGQSMTDDPHGAERALECRH